MSRFMRPTWGAKNTVVDALSHDALSTFKQVAPDADESPSQIPQALLALTVEEQPDWTSQRWAQHVSASCRQEWLGQRNGHISPERRNTDLLPGGSHSSPPGIGI